MPAIIYSADARTRHYELAIPLGDILADCGYSHRDAGAWAIPLRAAGARLVQDLHPHDRGPKGTHDGAIISNGSSNDACAHRSWSRSTFGVGAPPVTRYWPVDRV